MKSDLKQELTDIIETYRGYFGEGIDVKAHNKVLVEDLIRVFKNHNK